MSSSSAIIKRTVSLLCPDKEGKAQVEEAAAALNVHTTTLYSWLKHGLQTAKAESLARIVFLHDSLGDPLSPQEILELTQPSSADSASPR